MGRKGKANFTRAGTLNQQPIKKAKPPAMNSIWRVMDANLNRAREGLRVCEDLMRFVANRKHLTAKIKARRHALTQIILESGTMHRLISARESAHDVGKKSQIHDAPRRNFKSVLLANFKRTQESMRVLEECSKIVLPKKEKAFQALRFKIYELEKEVITKF